MPVSRHLFVFLFLSLILGWTQGVCESVFVVEHADSWTYDADKGTQTLTGKVHVTYEDLGIRAATVSLIPDRSKKKVYKAKAEGGVEIEQADRTAKGKSASYDFNTGTMEISEDAVVIQGSNSMKADKVRIARPSNAMIAEGKVSGNFSGGAKGEQQSIRLERSERWSFDPDKHLHELEGGVLLTLGDSRISASKMLIVMDETNQSISRAEAFPPLEIVREDGRASADSAVFFPEGKTEGRLLLKGHAKLKQGQNTMTGDEMTFLPSTGNVTGKNVSVEAQMEQGEGQSFEIRHADAWSYDKETGSQVLSGKVHVVYQELDLRAANVTMVPTQPGAQTFKARADGGVIVKSGEQTAQGNTATYDFETGEMEISGDSQVTQGDNTVRADQIRFSRKTGALTATGNVSGDFRGETKDSGKKGIHLTQAKKWTLDPVQHLHQLEGDVALSMEDTKIKASKIRLYMDEANQGILRAESDPPLEISQADLWATADSAIYYPATPSSEEQLVLKGNAKLNQGQNFMSGEEITFFPRTGTMGGKGVHVTVEVNEEQEMQP